MWWRCSGRKKKKEIKKKKEEGWKERGLGPPFAGCERVSASGRVCAQILG